MSIQLISILVLAGIFLIATVLPVHMGVLAFVATFAAAYFIYGSDDYADTLYGFFPGELFVVLVGVTFLFAIAKNNGTVDWLVSAAVKASGGRLVAIPWVMFVVTGALTAIGGVVPAVIAIIAPIGMAFARRYKINPLLMGLFIINGATAGGFSPLSIFGTITNSVVETNNLPGSPGFLWAADIVANLLLSVLVFFLFGGRQLLGGAARVTTSGNALASEAGTEPGAAVGTSGSGGAAVAGPVAVGDTGPEGVGTAGTGQRNAGTAVKADPRAPQTTAVATEEADLPVTTLDRDRILTLIGLAFLIVGALVLDLEIGLTALAIGAVLSVVAPKGAKGAVGQIAWPTVLLICGVVTFVGLLQDLDTPDYLGKAVAGLGLPLVAALLICYIGAVVSAFASTTGILGALIPLAVPFLQGSDAVGAVGLITALALSSSIVDSSPFSTSGALVVANSAADERDKVFRTLMIWGFSMVVFIPIVTWVVLVVPGWL